MLSGVPKNSESSACSCPVYRIIELVSKKWSLHILRTLADKQRMRFSDFQEELPEINSRMLSERLTELEEANLVVREVQNSKPTVVEYVITEKGEDLKNVFKCFCNWAKKWGETKE